MFEYLKSKINEQAEWLKIIKGYELFEEEQLEQKLVLISKIILEKETTKIVRAYFLISLIITPCIAFSMFPLSFRIFFQTLSLFNLPSALIVLTSHYELYKYSQKEPELTKLSINDLKSLEEEIEVKIEKIGQLIDKSRDIEKTYKDLSSTVDSIENIEKNLNSLDFFSVNAKVEDEYVKMHNEKQLAQAEWDKFVNEPVDYRNIDLKANDALEVKIKKIGSR